ncbi:MAG: 4-diphosphocytidyl-2C-methyl-D-erythritol kinase [Bacteroidia bacterium]|nr:MAG: 4-diphosphocytidyl-2C-methyl-D-erythritol kinase [Bacteroidia bacterium]
MTLPSPHIVLLAAGASERLGTPKQLLPYQGTTLIRHLLKVALDSRAGGVTVVLGAHADLIEPEISRMHVKVARNREWQTGISSSIRAGLEGVQGADSVLFMLSDQPLVTTPFLNSIIDRSRESPGRIVASAYKGTVGVPALFPHRHFSELSRLKGDEGAKSFLLRHRQEILTLPFPDGAVDIDNLSDLKKLRQDPSHSNS